MAKLQTNADYRIHRSQLDKFYYFLFLLHYDKNKMFYFITLINFCLELVCILKENLLD